MKYKLVVKVGDKTFVKDRNVDKEYLIKKAENLSRKHSNWKVYVVSENTMI